MSGRDLKQSAALPRLSSAPIAVSIRLRQPYLALDETLTASDVARPAVHPAWAWRRQTEATARGSPGGADLASCSANRPVTLARAEYARDLARESPRELVARS